MKKNRILIWGAKEAGIWCVHQLEKKYSIKFEIVGFGDNDCELHKKEVCGYRVYSFDAIQHLNLDGIVIASHNYEKEILYWLSDCLKNENIAVYKNLADMLEFRCSIDISGWCNAKCKYCFTGRKNRENKSNTNCYMKFDLFNQIYRHLIEHHVLNKANDVMLYSWGEPMLNPDYLKIIEFLDDENQSFSMSTNASVIQYAKKSIYRNCKRFVFSMSGMSQESYGKIHGFNVEIVKKNIENLLKNLRENGFEGEAVLSFHVYKFNQEELENARLFAEKNNMVFSPINAYFASYNMSRNYLTNKNDIVTSEGKQELNLSGIEEFLANRPTQYHCLVENVISIDYMGRIELCCCTEEATENHYWGYYNQLISKKSWHELRKRMLECDTCDECRQLKIDYWFFENPEYEVGEK